MPCKPDTTRWKLTHQSGTPSWRGATGEELNEFLLARVPPENVDVDIAGETPSKRVDVEKQLNRLRESDRALRMLVWIFSPVFVGLSVWMAIAEGLLKAIVMTVLTIGNFGPIFWFMQRDIGKRTNELEAMLCEFEVEEHQHECSRELGERQEAVIRRAALRECGSTPAAPPAGSFRRR